MSVANTSYKEYVKFSGTPNTLGRFQQEQNSQCSIQQESCSSLEHRAQNLASLSIATVRSYIPEVNIPLVKVATLAVVIGGLIVGTTLLGLLASSLAASGSAFTYTVLAGCGCGALGISTIYSFLSLSMHRMLEDTNDDNGKDCLRFTAETVFVVAYAAFLALETAVRVSITVALAKS